MCFYLRTIELINNMQWVTTCATYKAVSWFICLTLLTIAWINIGKSRDELLKSESTFNEKVEVLKKIIQNETYTHFFDDQRLCMEFNEAYINYHYGIFINFIKNEIVHLKLENKEADQLLKDSAGLGILITSFPLVLNLAWWTNSITLTCAILTKVLVNDSSLSSLNTLLSINIGLGVALLVIHLFNFLLMIGAQHKKNF
jgi:hypothetical protein